TPGHYHWRLRRLCRGAPCEAWRDAGDGEALSTTFADDGEGELSGEAPFGGGDTTRLTVHVLTPFLRLEGPTRVAKNATGTWNVRLAAAAPLSVYLYRPWLAPPASPRDAGGGPTTHT